MSNRSHILSSGHLEPGTLVDDRYQIVRAFGEGGFATVYEARQTRIDAVVALKVLRVEQMVREPVLVQRFLDEAKATASINHPNIIKVHDFGIIADTGQPYIAMERLFGHELKQELLDYGPMDPARTFGLFHGVLSGLGHSHSLGIVHKDLKPSNMFLSRPNSPEESLVVMDFGIARVQSMDSKTVTGNFVGTPRYYAPEYIREQIVTPALDVYQMGLILVEMLTGQPVVATNDPFQCIHDHCTGALSLPTALMSGPLGPVLKTALALDYTQRYADGYAFLDALRGIDPSTIDAGTEYSPGGVVVGEPGREPHTGHQARPSSNQIFRNEASGGGVPQVVPVGTPPSSTSQVQSHSNLRNPEASRPRLSPSISGGVRRLQRPPGSSMDAGGVDVSGARVSPNLRANSLDARANSRSAPRPQERANSMSAAPSIPRPPEQPAQGGSSMTWLLLGAAGVVFVLLLAGVVAGFLFMRPQPAPEGSEPSASAEAASGSAAAQDPEPTPAPEEASKGAAARAEAPADQEAPAEEAPAGAVDRELALCSGASEAPKAGATVQIQLESTPPGAPLFIGDQFLGITPCRWVRAKDSEATITLQVRHPSEPKTVPLKVALAKDRQVAIDLNAAQALLEEEEAPDERKAAPSRRPDGRRKPPVAEARTETKAPPPAADTKKKNESTKPVVIGRER